MIFIQLSFHSVGSELQQRIRQQPLHWVMWIWGNLMTRMRRNVVKWLVSCHVWPFSDWTTCQQLNKSHPFSISGDPSSQVSSACIYFVVRKLYIRCLSYLLCFHALQPPHSKISNFSVSHIICSNATYVYQTDHAVTSFSSLISRVIRSSKCSYTRACTLLVVLKHKWANFNRQTQCYALCWAVNECLIFLTPVCDNQSFVEMTIIYELEKSQSPPSLSSLWVLIKSPNIPISTTVQSHRCSSILLYCGWYVKSYVIVNGGKENQCEHIWLLCFIMISSAIF